MKQKAKNLSKKLIYLFVCAAVLSVILIAVIGLQIAFLIADRIECWRPDYEKINISDILDKDEISDDEYEILYRQTGLTKLGVDRVLSHVGGKARILKIQDDFFTEHPVKNGYFAPFICTDYIEKSITYAYLETGDIIVTSSTHLAGWRIGHAGLVTSSGGVIQASAIGSLSAIGRVTDFTDRVNFMILSPKADKEIKEQVADYAVNNLLDKVYNPTAGVFSSKYKSDKTQCAHLVWYAYNQFGIDLDCNGGPVVTPKDMANSPDVELVQVFGFDIDKLWK